MKKILAIVLAAAMLLALCACGGSAVDTGKLDEILSTLNGIQSKLDELEAAAPAAAPAEEAPAEEAPAEEAPAEEAPAEEAPAEEAPALEGADLSEIPEDAETLKIGLMINTTGWFAMVDTPNFYEFNALVDYINANGGWEVGGTTYYIEPVFMDGQSDNDALNRAAGNLADSGVKFVVETNDFWVNSCAGIFEEEGVLHASAYAIGVPDYITPDNTLAFAGTNGVDGDFQTCLAAINQYYPDVKTLVYANDQNGREDALFELLQQYAEPYGIEIVGSVIYPGDTTDYSSYAQQVVDFGADGFIGNGSPDAYGALLKAIRAQGSDMVMACAQAKPISLIMEYAGADASYNGFSIGASSREEDKAANSDLMNDLIAVVGEKYGPEAAASFDGAAAHSLYMILQMMKKADSVDPYDVAAAWEAGGEVENIYGTAVISAANGIENHGVVHSRPVSIMDPEAEDGWYFAGWTDIG